MKVQFRFKSNSWIQPKKKWSLRTDLEGNFYGELENFQSGAIEQSTSYRFERGDIVKLKLRHGLTNNDELRAGDTVGWLYSRLVDERITQLENLLIVQKQLLNTSATGEKTEIIENLRQKMLLAEQQYDFARKNYLRSEALFNDSVITASEFELAETAFLTATTNIDIAKSEYGIASTGAKPEEINLIKEQILAYENEINFLLDTKTNYLLTTPITGKISFTHYIPEQLEYLTVTDTSDYILYIPVKALYKPYLQNNMHVEIDMPGSKERFQASVFDISDKVDNVITNSIVYQVVFMKAKVLNSSPLITTGSSVRSTLYGDKITLREYIKRTIDIYFN